VPAGLIGAVHKRRPQSGGWEFVQCGQGEREGSSYADTYNFLAQKT